MCGPTLNNLLSMDLAENENFAFTHPYFFKNFTFKFENLEPGIKEKLENIVKSMGATVSDDSQYVFTNISQISLDQNKTYYSLSYFSNSILAEEPLDIEEYKFNNLVQNTNKSKFCCLCGRYILNTKSCLSYCNQHICCILCIEKAGYLKKRNDQDNGETNNANFYDINEESESHTEEISNLQFEESVERVDDLPLIQHEISSLHLDENSGDAHIGGENHNASIQSLRNDISQDSEVNKNNSVSSVHETIEMNSNLHLDGNSSDAHIGGENHNVSIQSLRNGISQDNEMNKNNNVSSVHETVEMNSNLHQDDNSGDAHISGENHNASIQSLANGISQDNEVNKNNRVTSVHKTVEMNPNVNLDKPSCSTQPLKKTKTNKSSSINRWKRTRTLSNSSDASSSSSDTRNPTRKRKNKRQKLSSSPSVSNKSPSTELPSGEEDEVAEELSYRMLDRKMNRKKWWRYLPLTIPNPHFVEPQAKQRGRGRDFSIGEKRLMIAYLVVNDIIHEGKTRRPWREIHWKGYLQDRSSESLSNHYRKIILPDIKSFKLPEDIERKFRFSRKYQ